MPGKRSILPVKQVFPQFSSKEKSEIIKEFRQGLKKGYRNIALTAEDVSVYGLDKGSNLAGLLRSLIRIRGEFSISLYRLNPEKLLTMKDGFLKIIKSKKINFLSIPVNSGSDRIIKLMGRKYDITDTKDYIKRIKKSCRHLRINLDLMVGFPGETQEDFKKTLEFVLDVAPDSIRVFQFTERPRTIAKSLGKAVPLRIMQKRSALLYQISRFTRIKKI